MIFALSAGELCPVIKKFKNYIFKHNSKCSNARSVVWYHIKSILIWVNSPFNCKHFPGTRLTRYTCIYVELVSNDDDDDDDYDDDEASRSESLLEVFC